jgi:hypothetical protein
MDRLTVEDLLLIAELVLDVPGERLASTGARRRSGDAKASSRKLQA